MAQASNGHHEETIGDIVMHHMSDIETWELPFGNLTLSKGKFLLGGLDLSITKPVLFLWIATFVALFVFILAFRKGLLGNRLMHILEVYIVFVRDEVVYPILGEKDGRKLLPFFLSIFFFILFCNLLGLIPFGYTATSNINVTSAMALIAFGAIQGLGIAKNGLGNHLKALVPHGLPSFIIPLMIPVEIVGMFAKPFALAIRLFANLTAGHAVVLVLLLLIIFGKSFIIAPFPILGALFILSLELFVSHLQAFIFTILTCLFVSMTMHPSH